MSINHRRISVAIASSLVLELINKISPLLILHHAQKNLGLTEFGWSQYQLAIFEIIQPFVSYGFANYALAETSAAGCSQDRVRRIFTHIMLLKIFHAVVVSSLYLLNRKLNGAPIADLYSLGILLLVVGSAVTDVFWYCILQHKLAKFTLLSGILRILAMLLILFFIKTTADSRLFVCLMLLPNAMIAISSGVYAFSQLKFGTIDWQFLKIIFSKSTPFALVVLLVTLVDRVDIFLVEKFFGLDAAGSYAGPAKIIQSLSLIAASLALPFYAEMLKVHDAHSLAKHTKLSLWFLSALIVPIVFGLPFIEGDVLQLVFSNLPSPANHLLSSLAIGMIGNIFVTVFGLQILIAKARPFRLSIGAGATLIFIPTVVWLTKDWFGYQAVAYSLVLGKIGFGLSCVYYSREFLPKTPWLSFIKPVLAGVAMAGFLSLLRVDGLGLNILAGGVSYSVCLLLINFKEFLDILQHPKVLNVWNRWRL